MVAGSVLCEAMSHVTVKPYALMYTEGIGGLYGGATAAVVSASLTSLLYFTAYDVCYSPWPVSPGKR